MKDSETIVDERVGQIKNYKLGLEEAGHINCTN